MIKFTISKGLIATAIAISAISVGTSTAYAGITTPASTLNTIVTTPGNYAWLGDATSQYNCLPYALDNYGSWMWPWGASNPTSTQVDSYLSGQGYNLSRDMGSSDVAEPNCIQ